MSLPVHPRTGLPALAVVGGRPVWPVLGAQDPPTPAPSDPPVPTDPAAPDPPDPAPQPDPQPDPEPQRVEDLPDWAQKVIRDTRAEAASNRTSKQQAEADKQATLDAVATALGLKPDATPDPEKLATDLASAQAESRQRAVELAVYRAAGGHGADPDALLDSRGFVARVAELDPAGGDFADRVGDAIKAAVADNPKLAAEPAEPAEPRRGGSDPRGLGQGRRQSTGPTGVQAGRALYEQRKNRTPIIT